MFLVECSEYDNVWYLETQRVDIRLAGKNRESAVREDR
jgi:hypothetical protein